MISRILKDLAAGGYVSVEKRRITIHGRRRGTGNSHFSASPSGEVNISQN
jgi:hypothetical protein